MKAAIIGDANSVKGFAAVGLDVFTTQDASEVSRLLRRLDNGQYAVIYITEALFSELEEEIDAYAERPIPAIIPIPGTSGNTGIGQRNVSKSVKRAVGSDIIS